MTDANKVEAASVLDGGGSDPNKVSPSGKGTTSESGGPGSSDTSSQIKDELGELKKQMESFKEDNIKLRAQDEANQKYIGQLGDDLGKARATETQSADIEAIARQFQDGVLNTEDPKGALAGVSAVVYEILRQRDNTDAERIKSYRITVDRNPALKDISYTEVIEEAATRGVDVSRINSVTVVENLMRDIQLKKAANTDIQSLILDAEKRGAEGERKKLSAAGAVIPSDPNGKPVPLEKAKAAPNDELKGFLKSSFPVLGWANPNT